MRRRLSGSLVVSTADHRGQSLDHKVRQGPTETRSYLHELRHVDLALALLEATDRAAVKPNGSSETLLGHARVLACSRYPPPKFGGVHCVIFTHDEGRWGRGTRLGGMATGATLTEPTNPERGPARAGVPSETAEPAKSGVSDGT